MSVCFSNKQTPGWNSMYKGFIGNTLQVGKALNLQCCLDTRAKKKNKGRKALSREGLLFQCSSGEFGSCQHIEGTQLKYLCYAQLLAGSCLGKVCFCVNTKACLTVRQQEVCANSGK